VYFYSRGKKQFRKFSDNDEAATGNRDALDEADGGLDSRLRRPLARSSIKPRLLFPPTKTQESNVEIDEEEAVTEIEDNVPEPTENDDPATPMELVDEQPNTPEAPRFAPASPPTTARTTRFGGKKSAEVTPMKSKPTGKRSPFDGWKRVKGGSESHGQKRSGDALPAGAAKRTRA
jgi:hypothetical protein